MFLLVHSHYKLVMCLWHAIVNITLIARFTGQHGAHLEPPGPRWGPCWPHELCYLGSHGNSLASTRCQAITWTNGDLLLIAPLRTSSAILYSKFSFRMHWMPLIQTIFGCQLDEPYGFHACGDHQQNATILQCHVHSCIYKVFSAPVSLWYSVRNKTYYSICAFPPSPRCAIENCLMGHDLWPSLLLQNAELNY